MRKLGFLNAMFAIILSTSLSHAQWPSTINANVCAHVPFGPYHYYFLIDGDGNYYKTAAIPDALMTMSQSVVLIEQSNSQYGDDYLVTGISSSYDVAAYLWDDEELPTGFPDIDESILPDHISQIDILFFTSEEHLDTNYALIDNIYDQDVFDLEDIISAYHSNFPGFYSYYHAFMDEFGLNDENTEFTDTDFDAMSTWFIIDDILKALFNSNRMIGIDKKIFLWFDHDIILSVSSDNEDAIEDLIFLSGNPDYLFHFLANKPITLESSGTISFTTTMTTRGQWEDVENNRIYRSKPVTHGVNCDNMTKGIEIKLLRSQDLTPSEENPDPTPIYLPYNILWTGVAELTVNWGDGITNVYTNYNGQVVWHTYANPGTYNPITTLKIYGGQGTLYDGINTDGELIEFDVNNEKCSNEPTIEILIAYSSDNKWKLLAEGSFEPRWGRVKVVANSRAFVKKENGNSYKSINDLKRKNRPRVRAEVDGKLYQLVNCDNIVYKDGSKSRKRHNVSKRKRAWGFGENKYSIGDTEQTRTIHRIGSFVEIILIFGAC